MNQLREWGFSANWWRGERGEYWVILQVILFIGFIILPIYSLNDRYNIPVIWQYISWGLTGFFGLIGSLLIIKGIIALGNNLTPLPQPKDHGELVTTGVYGLVRHPIYSGVIFLAIAYSIWQWSLSHGIATVILLIFFDIKARKEESWLRNKFSGYTTYQSEVKKLIPWIY